MPRLNQILRKGRKALQDLDVLKVLQSEISHELSSNRFQNNQSGNLGEFVVEHDSPKSQDVVLRRKCESGEEVAVSALIGPFRFGREGLFSREILMKVCVRKPGVVSLLQFDCGVSEHDESPFKFKIYNAYYLHSSSNLGTPVYRGPLFSTLDPQLQEALKEYLISRGIEENLMNLLLLHLHKKEQGQYLDWLRKLEASFAENL